MSSKTSSDRVTKGEPANSENKNIAALKETCEYLRNMLESAIRRQNEALSLVSEYELKSKAHPGNQQMSIDRQIEELTWSCEIYDRNAEEVLQSATFVNQMASAALKEHKSDFCENPEGQEVKQELKELRNKAKTHEKNMRILLQNS